MKWKAKIQPMLRLCIFILQLNIDLFSFSLKLYSNCVFRSQIRCIHFKVYGLILC